MNPPVPVTGVRKCLLLLVACGLGSALAASALPSDAADVRRELSDPYRVDLAGVVATHRLREIELVLPSGDRSWPERARRALEREVASEWVRSAEPLYGAIHPGIGVWLEAPLLTRQQQGRVQIPVLHSESLPIRGELVLPSGSGARRAVLLVDASSSANARTWMAGPDGRPQAVTVLEAERRALDHLVDLLEEDSLELGIIAFGEGTWPVAEPGVSRARLREELARFRREHPRGEGRTDLICALWLARNWLDRTPAGVRREIFLLTDGDLPHSGRFLDCAAARKRGGKQAQARCEQRRNRSVCPARRGFPAGSRRSDLVLLEAFGRKARGDVAVHPLLFEPDRAARAYRALAEATRGELVPIASPEAIDVVLPALIAGRVRGVFARNLHSGQETLDLLGADGRSFRGELPLRPGANDIELRVESERGNAALFRFRVHAAPGYLERYLAELRRGNRDLALRMDDLLHESRAQRVQTARRVLEVEVERMPAAPLPD